MIIIITTIFLHRRCSPCCCWTLPVAMLARIDCQSDSIQATLLVDHCQWQCDLAAAKFWSWEEIFTDFQWILWWIFLWLISLAEAVVRDLLNLSKIHQIINAIGRMNFLKRLPSWYLAWFEILCAWLPNTSSIQFAQFRRKYSDKCR